MSSKLDKKLHTHVVRTNPETMEREEIDLNDEGWKKLTNPDSIRKEWQKWLDEWVEMYGFFLKMQPPTQENFYVNHVALPEIMVMNYFHWPEELGVDVKFNELRGNKNFNPVIDRKHYNEYHKVDYEEIALGGGVSHEERARRHRPVLHSAYQYKVWVYTGKGRGEFDECGMLARGYKDMSDYNKVEWFPDLEVVNTNYSKDECYGLLDKCWEGVQEEGKHRKEYELLGDDYDILNCNNMKPHKSNWLAKKWNSFNTRRDKGTHYHMFTTTLHKRKILPKADLIKPFLNSQNKPNKVIYDIVDKSYLAYLGQRLEDHRVQTTVQGNRGSEEMCYMVVKKEYQESEGFVYRNYFNEENISK